MMSSYYETLDMRGKEWNKEKLEAVGLLINDDPLFTQSYCEITL